MNERVISALICACALFVGTGTVHAGGVAQTSSDPYVETRDLPRLVGPRIAVPEDPVERWALSRGESLREQLAGWAERAGWTLVWQSPWDYPVAAPAQFYGGFIEAVSDLMNEMNAAGGTLGAKLLRGNRVLLITENR